MSNSPETEVILSLCIVTYRACKLLRNCINSIHENHPSCTYEITVVDNHSCDETLEMLASEFPEVTVIALEKNEGYTKPMNYALRACHGQYLVQLNPDTLALPGTFDIILTYMESNPSVGICIPKVLNGDGSFQWQCRRSEARPWDVITYFTRLSCYFPHSPLFARYLMTYRSEDEIYEVKAVSGSCMFIRRELIAMIGYLDENFFAYQEDTDFCFRARKAGWKIMFYPLAKITHFGAEGGTRVHPYRSAYEWHRSYFLYYQKWLAKDYCFLLNWLFYILMGIKFGIALVKIFFSTEKYPSTRKPA